MEVRDGVGCKINTGGSSGWWDQVSINYGFFHTLDWEKKSSNLSQYILNFGGKIRIFGIEGQNISKFSHFSLI